MYQQGWTDLVLWDIARAIYLIKAESASVYVLFMFPLCINTRPNPLVRWEEGSTAKEHVSKLLLNRVHYRLFNLSLYLAVLHPGINHLFNPLIQPVKLPWFPLQELLLRRKSTQRRVYTNSLEISWNLTIFYLDTSHFSDVGQGTQVYSPNKPWLF